MTSDVLISILFVGVDFFQNKASYSLKSTSFSLCCDHVLNTGVYVYF